MTAVPRFANNASSRAATPITAADPSVQVLPGEGGKFPTVVAPDFFMVTLEDRRTGQIEICKCTSRSGDLLLITRAQEGTVAQGFYQYATVSNRLTAGMMNQLVSAAGVPEAPVDTKTYARKDSAWVETLTKAQIDATDASLQSQVSSNDTDITALQAVDATKEDKANKGIASGYASLDSSARVPAAQLPSYVDDVLEFANLAAFPATGAAGVMYVALDTNKIYRWSGTVYVEMSPSPGTTDAVPEGVTNLYFTVPRAAAAAPVQSVAGRTGVVVLTKADVGLSNVDNTSDANKPVSTAQQTALNLKLDSATAATTYAPIASPTFTGNPKAPTPVARDNDTSIATTAFVQTELVTKVDEAPNDGVQYVRKSLAWAPVSVPPGTAISDTPPVSPQPGQMWWESDTGRLYIWFDDGTTQQWVQVNGPAPVASVVPQGQCYLVTGGGNVILNRENGNQLYINGKNETIPALGVSLAPTGTAVATLYWIYAYMAAGVMTLERDAVNGPVVDAASGFRIKTGDATRTFVGAWASAAAGAWETTLTRGASWFNPKPKTTSTGTFSPSTASNSYVELSTSLRVDAITLGSREVRLTYQATVQCSVSTADIFTTIGVDGVSGVLAGARVARVNGTPGSAQLPQTICGSYIAGEGKHFYTPVGTVSATNTGTWGGSWMEVTILG